MLLPETQSVSEHKKNTRLLMNVKNVTELTVCLRTSSRNCEEDEQAEQEGAHGRRKSEERHGKSANKSVLACEFSICMFSRTLARNTVFYAESRNKSSKFVRRRGENVGIQYFTLLKETKGNAKIKIGGSVVVVEMGGKAGEGAGS